MLPRRLLPLFARFVLAWFALHVGAGVAAPALHPAAALQMVCAGGSLKALPGSGDDAALRLASIDCPLCAPAIAPPPGAVQAAVLPASYAPAPEMAIAAAPPNEFAPPPARGPPARIQA